MEYLVIIILLQIYCWTCQWTNFKIRSVFDEVIRDVNEASKVRGRGQGRGQIPQGRGRGQGQKNCEAEAELCEAEAEAWDAVLTMNY